jgi:RNA polymerase sigma factor (sigma-70 family)
MPARFHNDTRLAAAAAAGDGVAVDCIYRRYGDDLYRFSLSIVRDPEDARDVVQTTMVKAISGLRTVRPLKLKPWLLRIARNESVDLLRRRKVHAEWDEGAHTALRSVTDEAEARARLAELLRDLQDLPERQRSALVLRELCDAAYEDVAFALQISADAARQAVREARRSLQQRAEGRDASCDSIQEVLSFADGRLGRALKVRAHLRECSACNEFKDSIAARRELLRVLFPPMPVALGTGGLGGGTAFVGAGGTKAAALAASVGIAVGIIGFHLAGGGNDSSRADARKPAIAPIRSPAARSHKLADRSSAARVRQAPAGSRQGSGAATRQVRQSAPGSQLNKPVPTASRQSEPNRAAGDAPDKGHTIVIPLEAGPPLDADVYHGLHIGSTGRWVEDVRKIGADVAQDMREILPGAEAPPQVAPPSTP